MKEPLITLRPPRQLSKLEVLDIHILVKSTHPILGTEPKGNGYDKKN